MEILFSFDVCAMDWSIRPVEFKMLKAMDFKFDTHVPRDSPDINT